MKALCNQKSQSAACGLALLILLLPGCNGCTPWGGKTTHTGSGTSSGPSVKIAEHADAFFRFAAVNINRLEENDATELLEASIREIQRFNNAGAEQDRMQGDLLMASWVEPDMLRQIVEQLNDWTEIQHPVVDWKLDPMVNALDKRFLALPMLADLDQPRFTRFDGFMLMETAWLRDVSNWARGEKSDQLDQAYRLFDWTVRNIQLESDSPNRTPLFPWEVLLMGKGTASERMWVYLLLLRQQDIDAGIVALPRTSAPAATAGSPPPQPSANSSASPRLTPWCVGVSIGPPDSAKLYLFDPVLGVPIPASNGIGSDKVGQLQITPATLAEVQKNPKILDQIPDFDADHPYWAKKADLPNAAVFIEASPQYLSRRMKTVEARLVGNERLVLSTSPSDLAKRFESMGGVKQVELWQLPYTTAGRRMQGSPMAVVKRLMDFLPLVAITHGPLYRARILHLKGRFQTAADDSRGALELYFEARPTAEALKGIEQQTIEENFKKWYENQVLSLSPEARPAAIEQGKRIAASLGEFETTSLIIGKSDASYWAGLACFESGNYDSAIDWIRVRTLADTSLMNCPWLAGAHYNLARCLEAKGDRKGAIVAYQESIFDLLSYGNKVRAVWLKQLDEKGDHK